MKTKIISIALAVVTMLSAVALFSGCSDGEYPVEVANITIESQPKNIVVLDAPTADILIATGYDRYIVGRSDEVDRSQSQLPRASVHMKIPIPTKLSIPARTLCLQVSQ